MGKTVLIVGCGVMGLSTAVHLAEAGYSVTAIDAYPVPSPWSAAADMNKIIRTEYTDFKYTEMAVEAVRKWRTDPIYKEVYNECGRILMTPHHHEERRKFEAAGIECLRRIRFEGVKIEIFQGGQLLGSKFDFLKYNTVSEDTEIKWNPESGLAHAANSLFVLYQRACRLGVKFIFGDSGRAINIETDGGTDCIRTKDDSIYRADIILISAGAASGYLVDLRQQQSATGLFVTHIRLTEKEYETLKDIPIVFDAEMGYFFPPDKKTHLLKIALSGLGGTNNIKDPFREDSLRSLPRYKTEYPNDTMPILGKIRAKKLLGKYIPEVAYHTLIESKTCWIADTADSNFIIDKVPNYCNIYVATGDSGHAFKFLPTIGGYILEMLEGTLDKRFAESWKWKNHGESFDVSKCKWRVVADYSDFSDIKWVEKD
ncbi:uncharacterized protein PRCAT00002452001 [Priceomyces carsonii]|uniref:uncharacterized protein n=1 Tax=Priceomyces carsonii TaxID=28549 RepID=UPI002ED7EAD1|nr:unnamed protein product [Priceomyces carsonii]